MKMEELLKMEKNELHAKLASLRKDSAKAKLDLASGKSTDTHKIRGFRKDIARVLTAMNKKQ